MLRTLTHHDTGLPADHYKIQNLGEADLPRGDVVTEDIILSAFILTVQHVIISMELRMHVIVMRSM